MKRLIADASRIGNAVLPDERTAFTEALIELIATAELIEPAHWPVEVANFVVKASRRERLTLDQRSEAREAIAVLIQSAEVEHLSYPLPAFDLAVKHHIGVYDAGYLELALRTGLPLLTSDGPLRGAAIAAKVELVALP